MVGEYRPDMQPHYFSSPMDQSSHGIPFTCSRTESCVLEHCSGMLERNISAQFYCSVLNGVYSEHCSVILKYDSSFRHLESRGNSLAGSPHLDLFRTARTQHTVPKYSIDLEHIQSTRSSERNTPMESYSCC